MMDLGLILDFQAAMGVDKSGIAPPRANSSSGDIAGALENAKVLRTLR